MSGPIVFISNQRIKKGKLDGYIKYYREVAAITEQSKPGTLAHLAYRSEDGTEASVVHVFPDAEAIEAHMQGIGEVARKASEFMEVISFQIYGNPGDRLLEAMTRAAGGNVAVTVTPEHVGGYMRLR